MRILNRSFPYYESDLAERIYENSRHIKKYLQPQKSLNAYLNGASAIVIGRSITKGNIKKNIQKLIKSLD